MKNNAVITTRDISTFKRIITNQLDLYCDDMAPADVSELLLTLHKEVDNFCLACLTLSADTEDGRDFKIRREINNNAQ